MKRQERSSISKRKICLTGEFFIKKVGELLFEERHTNEPTLGPAEDGEYVPYGIRCLRLRALKPVAYPKE